MVGVAGFEPAASSSRTKASRQASAAALPLTCELIPQDPPASPRAIQARGARVAHGLALYHPHATARDRPYEPFVTEYIDRPRHRADRYPVLLRQRLSARQRGPGWELAGHDAL